VLSNELTIIKNLKHYKHSFEVQNMNYHKYGKPNNEALF
jgi:hypothetical protein